MNKYIITLFVSLFLANVAAAHHGGVNIQHADKVFVKSGHCAKAKMMKCMLALKKYSSADEAIDAAIMKIDDKCKKYSLDEKKCNHIKKRVVKGIVKCFTAKEFFMTFFGKEDMGAKAEAPAPAPAPAPEAVKK